jgi:hypothetical protein
MKDSSRCLAENRAPCGLRKGCVVDDPHRSGVTDRKGIVRAENYPIRTGYVTQKTQRMRLEQHRIETKLAKTVERTGLTLGMKRAVCASTGRPRSANHIR